MSGCGARLGQTSNSGLVRLIECQKHHFPPLPIFTTRLTGSDLVTNAIISNLILELNDMGHSTPLIETSYNLTLRAARTLLERFRRKSYGFNTQFTHVSRHF